MLKIKDLQVEKDYLIVCDSRNVPFRLLEIKRIETVKYPGTILKVRTLDGEDEFFEADDAGRYGLSFIKL